MVTLCAWLSQTLLTLLPPVPHSAGVQPPGPFMDAALARSLELVAEATPREVTDTLAALARLRYRPPDAWLAAYTAAVRAWL